MSFDSYLLDAQDLDWATVADEWDWLVPAEVHPLMLTLFGDVFLHDPSTDGIHLLDLENGTYDFYTDRRIVLIDAIASDSARDELLLSPLIDSLVADGMTLRPGVCYHFKIPTILGGDFGVDNIAVIDLAQRIRFCGDLHRQIKDLPDGSPVRLKIVE